jgi:hypothetical protein
VWYTTPMRTPIRAVATIAAAVVAVAMILGGCSSSSTSDSPSPSTTPAAALKARIVTKVPRNFVAQPDEVGDTGPSDLAKAAKDEGATDGGKELRSEKFLRGYQRLWIGPEHAQIIVFVYQFGSAAGARHHFARTTKRSGKPPPGVHTFTATFLPPEQVSGIAGTDKNGSAAVIAFTSGIYSVQIICNGARLPGLQARAISIAEDQHRRL